MTGGVQDDFGILSEAQEDQMKSWKRSQFGEREIIRVPLELTDLQVPMRPLEGCWVGGRMSGRGLEPDQKPQEGRDCVKWKRKEGWAEAQGPPVLNGHPGVQQDEGLTGLEGGRGRSLAIPSGKGKARATGRPCGA